MGSLPKCRGTGPARIGALATVLATCMAFAAGCGEGDEGHGSRNGEPASQTASQTSSSKSSGGSQQSQSSQSGSGSVSSSQSSTGGDGVQTFTGNGPGKISKLKFDPPARLVWTNSKGRLFTLKSSSPGISVRSRSGLGEIRLESGSYRDIEVRGDVWTIIVRPP